MNYKWWALEIPRNKSSINPVTTISPVVEGLALMIHLF